MVVFVADVAISAPFGDGEGTVFIYHSSASQLLLTPTPQQVRATCTPLTCVLLTFTCLSARLRCLLRFGFA